MKHDVRIVSPVTYVYMNQKIQRAAGGRTRGPDRGPRRYRVPTADRTTTTAGRPPRGAPSSSAFGVAHELELVDAAHLRVGDEYRTLIGPHVDAVQAPHARRRHDLLWHAVG